VVSEHPAVVSTFSGGLVVSLLEPISSELSAVIPEGRNNRNGDAEFAGDASSQSAESEEMDCTDKSLQEYRDRMSCQQNYRSTMNEERR